MTQFEQAVFTGFGFVLLVTAFSVMVSMIIGLFSIISKVRLYNSFSHLLRSNKELSEQSKEFIRNFCSRRTQEKDRIEVMQSILEAVKCKEEEEKEESKK